METTATITKLRTILLVGILSISMLSAGIGSVGAAPAHSSIGSVSVDDRSAAGSTPAPPADPDEWDLRSAKHSDTMSAEIIIDEEQLRGITITDDVNHEGRDVSISRDALAGSIEEIPDKVTGVHEDGSRWTSEVRVSGDRVIVYVPHFSTQTITFSSQISIDADPADSGAAFEYDIANDTNITSPSLSITGSTNKNWKNVSKQSINDGEQISLDIGGNTDPVNSSVKFTGIKKNKQYDTFKEEGVSADGTQMLWGDGYNGGVVKTSWQITPNKDLELQEIVVNRGRTIRDDYGFSVDVRIDSGSADSNFGEGTLINDSLETEFKTGKKRIQLDTTKSLTKGQNYEIEFITQNTDNDGNADFVSIASFYDSGAYTDYYYEADSDYYSDLIGDIRLIGTETLQTDSPAVDIDGDGNNDTSVSGQLSDGETVTKSLPSLSLSDDTTTVRTAKGPVGVDISLQEQTISTDPEISINSDAGSQTVSYSGTLSDGSTADLSGQIDKSLIDGNVTLSVNASESVSSGPIGQVGLDYAHDAQESKQISYSGEEFSERYSFTHQWPHDRASASITIPWASDRVVDVRSVKVNGQEATQYSAADGELIVDLGSVQSGDQTNVTAVGSKVSVSGGEISVDDPTTQGDDLDSGISVQSLSEQTLEIDVSDSYHVDERDRMIYVPDSSASWSGADPITRIEPGSQTVEIDPTSSSSFRLRSAGVGSSIPSGDAVLRMEDASEPRVSVSPGETEGDTLKLTYHDTVSGDYYRVVDSEGNPLDTDRASSPAEFRISDTTGIFAIEQFTPEAIVSGISSGAAAVSSGDSLIPPWLALIATLSVSILGLAYASTRTEIGSSMLGRRLIIGGGLVLGYIGAELVTGERLYRIGIDALSGGLSDLIGATLSALGAGAGAGSGAISGLADIGFISLVLGIGLLVGLYAIDQRTGLDIPRAGWGIAGGLISVWIISQLGIGTGVSIGGQQSLSIVLGIGLVLGLLALDQRGILSIPLPLYAGAALLVGVYVLETLAPGSVLGPLQSGLDQVGPLIWLGILGGALLLLWVWLRSNRPQIQILGRGGQQ